MVDFDPIIIAALGALVGGFAKFFYDNWAGNIAWKREFKTHTRQKVENQSFSYHRMSNYAEKLAENINNYNKIKLNLQVMSIVPGQSVKCIRFNPYYALKCKESVKIAKKSFYNAGKFLRILNDAFLQEGMDYFLPEWWATRTLKDLQYALIDILPFDTCILLKYVDDKIEFHAFNDKIESAECSDLKEIFNKYKDWLFNDEIAVKQLSNFANAYDDLFNQQIDLFNQDWYEKANGWLQIISLKKTVKKYDPEKYRDDTTEFARLQPETRELIEIFNSSHINTKEEVKDLVLTELSDNLELSSVNSLISNGWGHYSKEEYDLAILAYKKALKLLSKWFEKNRSEMDVYARKKSMLHNNLANVYSNKGIVDKNNENHQKAEENFIKAISEFESIKKCQRSCKNSFICKNNQDIYYVNHAICLVNQGQNMAQEILEFDQDNSKRIIGCYDNSIELLGKSIKFKENLMDLHNITNKFKDISYYYHLIGYVICHKIDILRKINSPDLNREIDRAIKNYLLAISLNPTEHIFYINLSHLYNRNEEIKFSRYYKCKGVRLALGHVNDEVQEKYSKEIDQIYDDIQEPYDSYSAECKKVYDALKDKTCKIEGTDK